MNTRNFFCTKCEKKYHKFLRLKYDYLTQIIYFCPKDMDEFGDKVFHK